MGVYTLGIWRVKDGRADDFVRAWLELAEQTQADFPAGTATLLRDRDQPSLFTSFGPWDSLEQIAQWRNSPTFQDGVAKLRELLDSFEPHTMDIAATIS
jgi:quinol monooxygenase YgiN